MAQPLYLPALSRIVPCVAAVMLLQGIMSAQAQIPVQDSQTLMTPTPAATIFVASPTPKIKPVEVTPESQPTVAPIPAVEPFLLKQVDFSMEPTLPAESLNACVAPYLQQMTDTTRLQALSATVANCLKASGYLLNRVSVESVHPETGRVTLAIHEDHVGSVSVAGRGYFRNGLIQRLFSHDEKEPFNAKRLEQEIVETNKTAPYKLHACVSHNQSTDQADVSLKVLERQPWQVTATVDNQGRPRLGTYRTSLEVSNQNLLGFGDRASVKILGATETRYIIGSYTIPLNRRGTEFTVSSSANVVTPDFDPARSDDWEGRTNNIKAILSHPLDRNRYWRAELGFTYLHVSNYKNDNQVSNSEGRYIVPALTYSRPDRWGKTNARLLTTVGTGMMGGDLKFWRVEGSLNRTLVLPHRSQLTLRLLGQLSPDRLPAGQSLGLGGEYSVRGFTEGLLIADRGYVANLEYQYPIPLLNKVSPALDKRVRGVAFVDAGQGWLDSSNSRYIKGYTNQRDNNLLVSLGVGFRYQLTRFLSGFVDLACGLGDRDHLEANAQPSVRVHFGIRSDLFPQTMHERRDIPAHATQQAHHHSDDKASSI